MLSLHRVRPMYRPTAPVRSSIFRALSTSPPEPLLSWASPNSPFRDNAPDIASEDPVYQQLQKAYTDYQQKQDAFGGEKAQIFAKNKQHAANMTKDKEAALKLDQDDGAWFGMDDKRNSLKSLAQGTEGRFYNLPPDAGDPFGCDDAQMRQAKAGSEYAWVSLQDSSTEFLKLMGSDDDPGYVRNQLRKVRSPSQKPSLLLHRAQPRYRRSRVPRLQRRFRPGTHKAFVAKERGFHPVPRRTLLSL